MRVVSVAQLTCLIGGDTSDVQMCCLRSLSRMELKLLPTLISTSCIGLLCCLRQAIGICQNWPFRAQGDIDCLLLIKDGGTKVAECLPSMHEGLRSVCSPEKRRHNHKRRHTKDPWPHLSWKAAVNLQKSNDYGFVPIWSRG